MGENRNQNEMFSETTVKTQKNLTKINIQLEVVFEVREGKRQADIQRESTEVSRDSSVMAKDTRERQGHEEATTECNTEADALLECLLQAGLQTILSS